MKGLSDKADRVRKEADDFKKKSVIPLRLVEPPLKYIREVQETFKDVTRNGKPLWPYFDVPGQEEDQKDDERGQD